MSDTATLPENPHEGQVVVIVCPEGKRGSVISASGRQTLEWPKTSSAVKRGLDLVYGNDVGDAS